MPSGSLPTSSGGMPARAGVGLKPEHYRTILATRPDVGFFEVHAENYMGAGGPPHHYLSAIRERYPLSLHGVGLSIGSDRPLDHAHLQRLKALSERYAPTLFSEHLAWSTHDTGFLNDLLPLPYTGETLGRVVEHIDQVQQALGRRMLLENPSTYLAFAESSYSETDFLTEIVRRSGCGLLLDVNNVQACRGAEPGRSSSTATRTSTAAAARAISAASTRSPRRNTAGPTTSRPPCPRSARCSSRGRAATDHRRDAGYAAVP